MSRIVLTDAPTPANVDLGKTQVYAKNGSAGLFYKQGTDPEVGPLSAGSTVTDLQTAYNGGASIVTTVADGAVSISSTLPGGPDALTVTVGGSTDASGVVVTHGGPGASPAIEAVITNPACTGNVISSTSNFAGSALYAETTGAGNGVTVYASPGSIGRGISSLMAGTGSAVYVEKSNAGDGIEVKMPNPAIGSGLTVTSLTTLATSPGIAVNHSGSTVGVFASMTNVGDATGFSAYLDAAAPSSRGLAVEFSDASAAGTGVSVTFSGATATGTGMSVEFSGATATGVGLDISNTAGANSFQAQKITMASGSTGTGIELTHNGTGTGVGIGMTGAGSGVGIGMTGAGTATTRGLKVLATNPAAVFYGVEVDVESTKAPLLLSQRGSGLLVEARYVTTPVFTVDIYGNTTTPSVIFGGSGTITVEGDSGVAGEPINPRVSLTSGSVVVGVLARTWYAEVKEGSGAGPFNMETVGGAQYIDIRNQQPTLISWQNTSGVPQTVYLPDAARYPLGTEIQFWNIPGNNVFLTDFGAGGQQIRDLSSVAASQTVTPGSGRRLVALGADGWFVTGVI